MSTVDKYARQLNIIGNQCQALLKQCQSDDQLTEAERQDITWELARVKEDLAQAIAALVSIAVKSDDL